MWPVGSCLAISAPIAPAGAAARFPGARQHGGRGPSEPVACAAAGGELVQWWEGLTWPMWQQWRGGGRLRRLSIKDLVLGRLHSMWFGARGPGPVTDAGSVLEETHGRRG